MAADGGTLRSLPLYYCSLTNPSGIGQTREPRGASVLAE